jgi:hypothetical protein
MAKQTKTASELVESHIPKNFKYRYIITDDNFYRQLIDQNFDLDKLDTIHDDELVQKALRVDYKLYEKTIIGKAKEPTVFDDGVIISKKMITKTGKNLNNIGLGFFEHNETRYVVIRMYYEEFDIIEIFILT